MAFALVIRRPYCPGGPKKLCFTTLSLIPMVSIARLSVVKQSSFDLRGQYGRRMTRVNWNDWSKRNPNGETRNEWNFTFIYCNSRKAQWPFFRLLSQVIKLPISCDDLCNIWFVVNGLKSSSRSRFWCNHPSAQGSVFTGYRVTGLQRSFVDWH